MKKIELRLGTNTSQKTYLIDVDDVLFQVLTHIPIGGFIRKDGKKYKVVSNLYDFDRELQEIGTIISA